MNNLRVCLVCDNFLPNYDGVVNVVINYHNFFLKHAHSLLVVPKIGNKNHQPSLENVYYVPSTPFIRGYTIPYPYLNKKLKKILNEFKPNIIHIHSPFVLGKYFIKYAKKNNIPCLMTFHTKYEFDFKMVLKLKLLSQLALKSIINVTNKVPNLFTVSQKIKQVMYSYGVKKNKSIGVLRNATEFKTLPKHHYDAKINKKFKITSNDFVITYVGRLVKYKNLNFMINLAHHLSKSQKHFKCLICGSGEHFSWMKNKVKKLGLTHHFIFAGKIMDRNLVQKIYARSNLNLMVSLFDTTSLSIIEAASQYCPSLVIKNSTVASGIINNVNGYAIDNSPKKAAMVVSKIIQGGARNQYEAICKKAHQDLYITWGETLKYAQKVYMKLLSYKH